MYCPNCKQHYDGGKFCPECGTPLVDDPKDDSPVNFNLGDANAFAGNVSLSNQQSDSHNHVETHNTVSNNVNNTDSHDIINNIVHERQKTSSEIYEEKKKEFAKQVAEFYSDGILSEEEIRKLEEMRIHIDLDKTTAQNIISEMSTLKRDTGTLSRMDQMNLHHITELLDRNDTDRLRRDIRKLETMSRRTGVEEVRFFYYLLLATLDPAKCISIFENSADNYWRTYWTCIAYLKKGNVDKATELMEGKLQMWNTVYPEENVYLLQVVLLLGEYVNSKDSYTKEEIDDFLNACYQTHTPFLDNFLQALVQVEIFIETGEMDESADNTTFYIDNILSDIIKVKKKELEEQRLAKEEAERKAREEAERKAKEAAERRRFTVRIVGISKLLVTVSQLMKVMGWNLKTAKSATEALPFKIKTFKRLEDAKKLMNQLNVDGMSLDILTEEVAQNETKRTNSRPTQKRQK